MIYCGNKIRPLGLKSAKNVTFSIRLTQRRQSNDFFMINVSVFIIKAVGYIG